MFEDGADDDDTLVLAADVRKAHGSRSVLRDVDFRLRRTETVAVVGPSGGGKSTLLRILAGLEAADHGEIRLLGRRIQRAPVSATGIGFLFQNYALFPHMTVGQNLAYPLKRTSVRRAELEARVGRALATIGLEHAARRRPSSLSGGEQQRVALMRALIHEPAVLFLDEPFSALDVGLALELEEWLFEISRSRRHGTVLVTHDPAFALSVADSVCVLHAGTVAQWDGPRRIWSRPATAFVARFFGPVNEFEVDLDRPMPAGAVRELPVRGIGAASAVATADVPKGRAVLMVRPSAIRLEPAPAQEPRTRFTASVTALRFRGADCWAELLVGAAKPITAQIPGSRIADFAVGDRVDVSWQADDAFVFGSGEGGQGA